MEFYDLKIKEDGDISDYESDQTGLSFILSALLTNSRVGEKEGYWIDLYSSELWYYYEQNIITLSSEDYIIKEVKRVLNILKNDNYILSYGNISMEKNNLIMEIQMKNNKKTIISQHIEL